jgi:predicted metal-binding protein
LAPPSSPAAGAARVKTAARVRLKCRFGCGGYGGRLARPPRSPAPERTAEALACFERRHLVLVE